MDRLQEIEVFVAVAEAGGLSRAATRLRLSPPTVTRALASLEDRLGVRLFNRTTRSLTITDAGQRFLDRSRRILTDLDDAQTDVAGEAVSPQGHLSITASVTLGRSLLAPVICEFLSLNRRVTVSAIFLDRITNLVEEGIDIAVRIGELPESGLVARKVGSVRRLLVASPDYLERNGAPASFSDLAHHSIIGFTGLMPVREWHFQDGTRNRSISLTPAFEVNDALAALQAAEASHGVSPALSYMVSDSLRRGRLVEVLPEGGLPAMPVHIVHISARLVASRVRAFIDFAGPRLAERLGRATPDGTGA
jgi:DNA-binding transcriptional LysR family regulator